MATYSFETITAAQAASITASDTLNITTLGRTNQTSVFYNPASADFPDGSITVVLGDRSVTFSNALSAISRAGELRAVSSFLFIGDGVANSFTVPDTIGPLGSALYGGGGVDTLRGGVANDLLQGNTGNDSLRGGDGDDVIYGGQDNDQVNADAGRDFVQGNKGDDTITGGPGGDIGQDTLLGGQGDDNIAGRGPDSFLNGNLGADTIVGFRSQIFGEGGNDTLSGSDNSAIFGGDGDDSITTASSAVDAGAGNDLIKVDFGSSTVQAGVGNDTIDGHLALRFAGLHNDLRGDDGQDSIWATVGTDTLSGGSGDDTLDGQGSDAGEHDMLYGGAGSDLFRISDLAFLNNVLPLDAAYVMDWDVGDHLHFLGAGLAAGSGANYGEISAETYESAFNAASTLRRAESLTYVSVQVGADVVVFSFPSAGSSQAVFLVGRSLTDIDFGGIQ